MRVRNTTGSSTKTAMSSRDALPTAGKCTPLLMAFPWAGVFIGRDPVPDDWSARRLYLGDTGSRNWREVTHEDGYPLRDTRAFGLARNRALAAAVSGARTIVSLGPGDGSPDTELVEQLSQALVVSPAYVPVDLSLGLLEQTLSAMSAKASIPAAILCDFESEQALLSDTIRAFADSPLLLSLTGGTIGNLDLGEESFLRAMRRLMHDEDSLLIDVPLAGPCWSADSEPRLNAQCYTPAFRRFVAGGLADMAPDSPRSSPLNAFESRVELVLVNNGSADDVQTVRIRDRASGHRVLDFRRFRWPAFLAALPTLGFRAAFREAAYEPSERFGMGVVLLQPI